MGKKLDDKLPAHLKSEVLVRARQEHPDIQAARAEVVRNTTVNELSQINSFNEFPLPKNVDQLIGRAPRPVERRKKFRMMQRSQSAKNFIPESMKAQVLVKSRVEDPEVREFRRNLVESKSVSELSQISGLSDFPIPSTIDRFMSKIGDFSSISTPSFDINNIYATLPSSLKTDLMVRSRIEDPEIQSQRRQIAQSKSVSELSQIQNLGEFPIPTTIEKLMAAKKQSESNGDANKMSILESLNQENIYATLPRSLKSEVLVRTRVEDPEVLATRQETVQSKSVYELSKLNSFSDFPLPTPVEKIIQGKTNLRMPNIESGNQEGGYDIYASLPRSLKQEVLVRTKVEEDEEVLHQRQAIVSSKSPAELSQIHSFAEVPIPRAVESWLHHQGDGGNKLLKSPSSKSFHELSATVYDSLPQSLKEPCAVRSKIEDPELQRERFELTRSKTPSQLAEMRTLGDIPVPGLWEHDHGRSSLRTRSLSGRSSSIPRNKQELKDMVYNKMLPDSLKRPVVVRCVNEDPDTLKKHQEVQQSKSVHELSKIRNLNEFPLPVNIRLPDVPLPKVSSIVGVIARVPKKKPRKPPVAIEHDENMGYSTASTPAPDRTYTDDEMLRYEMSSPEESMAHREQDFDYEVIEAGLNGEQEFMQTEVPMEEEDVTIEEESEVSVADHYKGTPPLKSKKNKRFSRDIPSDFQVKSGDDLPPPIPPKGKHPSHHDFPQREPRELTEQDLMGSNEMLFIADNSGDTPQFHPPGPKIAFSYQHDPKTTPMRKISSSSE